MNRHDGVAGQNAIASGFGPVALQMRDQLIERVNAAFGYRAVSDITFVQTLPPVANKAPGTNSGTNSGRDAAIGGQTVWDLDRAEYVLTRVAAALRRLGTDDEAP